MKNRIQTYFTSFTYQTIFLYDAVRYKDLLHDVYADLSDVLKSSGDICAIVYCLERTMCDDLSVHLSQNGISCAGKSLFITQLAIACFTTIIHFVFRNSFIIFSAIPALFLSSLISPYFFSPLPFLSSSVSLLNYCLVSIDFDLFLMLFSCFQLIMQG